MQPESLYNALHPPASFSSSFSLFSPQVDILSKRKRSPQRFLNDFLGFYLSKQLHLAKWLATVDALALLTATVAQAVCSSLTLSLTKDSYLTFRVIQALAHHVVTNIDP
jgi:hypothetical protein